MMLEEMIGLVVVDAEADEQGQVHFTFERPGESLGVIFSANKIEEKILRAGAQDMQTLNANLMRKNARLLGSPVGDIEPKENGPRADVLQSKLADKLREIGNLTNRLTQAREYAEYYRRSWLQGLGSIKQLDIPAFPDFNDEDSDWHPWDYETEENK